MRDFDQEIRKAIAREVHAVPEAVRERTEKLLNALPEREKPPLRLVPRLSALAACTAFVLVVLLPNVSTGYAQSVEAIPIIGNLVQVFTLRSYFYNLEHYHLEAAVPNVADAGSPDASSLLNKNVDELTEAVIHRFYDELQLARGTGVGSIHMDYAVVTNTAAWFTLRLTVEETVGSTDSYSRFYHIDRVHGAYVQLNDLINESHFPELEEMIRRQMEQQMQEDPAVTYLMQDRSTGESTLTLHRDQGFYFRGNGDLVIVYDRYAVAPGSMGCPEFVLPRAEIAPMLRYPAP